MDGELSRLHRYEDRSATPMTVFAVAFLLVYSARTLWIKPPETFRDGLEALNWGLWAVFVADLGVRAWLSGKPLSYIVRHPIDLLLVLLPMLRPLRVLRVFTAMATMFRHSGRISIGQTMAGTAGAALLLMFIAAVAMVDAERDNPEAKIQTFGDAIWWAGATITTVGYGDMYPITWMGRWVAFVLMLVGISVLGVVTASIAAWFVGRGDAGDDTDLVAEIRALRDEVAELRDQQSVSRAGSGRTEA